MSVATGSGGPHSAKLATCALPSSPGCLATVATPSFQVPGVYDPVFYNQPDSHSVLVHACSSSSVEGGFQAIVCFFSKPDLPSHLGLPLLSNYEDKVFLQMAKKDQPFLLYSQVPRGQSLQITVTEYLILLQFVAHEWPRLKSKLKSQLVTMREGTDPVYISGHLVFYNHGSCHYRVSLSSRLVFRAKMESREEDNVPKTWLERKQDANTNSACHDQEMSLPMESLGLLANDSVGIKALTDYMANYKSRSRKRTKAVVS